MPECLKSMIAMLRLETLSGTVMLIILMNAIVEFMNVAKREMLLPYLRTLVTCEEETMSADITTFSGSPYCPDIRIVIEESQSVCGDMDSMNSIVNGVFTPFFGLICDQKGRKVGLYLSLLGLFLYFSILSFASHSFRPYRSDAARFADVHLAESQHIFDDASTWFSRWIPGNPFSTARLPISGLIPLAMMVEGFFNCFEIVFAAMLVDVTLPGPQRALVFAVFSSVGIVLDMSADIFTSSLLLRDFRNYKLLFLAAAVFTVVVIWVCHVFLEETLGHNVFGTMGNQNSAIITSKANNATSTSSQDDGATTSATNADIIVGGFPAVSAPSFSSNVASMAFRSSSPQFRAIEMQDFTHVRPQPSLGCNLISSSPRSPPKSPLQAGIPDNFLHLKSGVDPHFLLKSGGEALRVKPVTDVELKNPILLYSGFELHANLERKTKTDEIGSSSPLSSDSTDTETAGGIAAQTFTNDISSEQRASYTPKNQTTTKSTPKTHFDLMEVAEFEHQSAIEDEVIPFFEFREFHYLAVCNHHLDSTYSTKNPLVEGILKGNTISPSHNRSMKVSGDPQKSGEFQKLTEARHRPDYATKTVVSENLTFGLPGTRNHRTVSSRSATMVSYLLMSSTDLFLLLDYCFRFVKHYFWYEIPRFTSYTYLLYGKIFAANPFLQWWCILQFFLQFAKGLVEVQGSYSILIWGWHAGDLERITVWLTGLYLIGLSATPYVLANSGKVHKLVVGFKIDRCFLCLCGSKVFRKTSVRDSIWDLEAGKSSSKTNDNAHSFGSSDTKFGGSNKSPPSTGSSIEMSTKKVTPSQPGLRGHSSPATSSTPGNSTEVRPEKFNRAASTMNWRVSPTSSTQKMLGIETNGCETEPLCSSVDSAALCEENSYCSRDSTESALSTKRATLDEEDAKNLSPTTEENARNSLLRKRQRSHLSNPDEDLIQDESTRACKKESTRPSAAETSSYAAPAPRSASALNSSTSNDNKCIPTDYVQRLSELSATSSGSTTPVNFRSILILGAFLNVVLEGVLAISAPFNWKITLTAQGGRSFLAWYHSLKTSYVTTKIPEEQRATSLAIITVVHSFAEASADFLFSHYFFISAASARWMLGLPYFVAFGCIFFSEVILVFVAEKYKDIHYDSEEAD